MFMARTETKSIFEPDVAKGARLDAEALAAYRSGRYVPHAKVSEWLTSWGTGNVLPCPKPELALQQCLAAADQSLTQG